MFDSKDIFYDKTKESLSSICVTRKYGDNFSLNNLFEKLRYVGASCGSVHLKSNEISSDAAWFNYLYIPYTGGTAEDNRNYGSLYLIPTFGIPGSLYVISFNANGVKAKTKINLTSF